MTIGATGVAAPLALQEGYERWFAALAQGRRSEVEPMLAPDFRYTDFHGVVWGREAYLELTELGCPGTRHAVVTELHVRDLGSHVVVDGVSTLEGADDRGRNVLLHCHFNGLWRRCHQEWLCVLHHDTNVRTP